MVYGHKGGGKWIGKKLPKKTVFSLAFADETFVNLLIAGRKSDFIEDLYKPMLMRISPSTGMT